ncbi:Single-stranded DNA-binding protein ssb [Clostridiales bacterium CHKCI006]|nr:Single-stranded DNA-binding protein ssb [Clostridiales bacterium CHKCI006]
MLNRVVLVGRMTRDPELRRTANGTPVASFTLAMNRNFSSQNGERQADFIPCVVWNKAAENTAKYCSKGSLVGVDGRLQSRSYQNQDGRRVSVIEVICDSVQFLETRAMSSQRNTMMDQMPQTSNQFDDSSFYDVRNNDMQKDFDNSMDTYDIMDDDIQF